MDHESYLASSKEQTIAFENEFCEMSIFPYDDLQAMQHFLVPSTVQHVGVATENDELLANLLHPRGWSWIQCMELLDQSGSNFSVLDSSYGGDDERDNEAGAGAVSVLYSTMSCDFDVPFSPRHFTVTEDGHIMNQQSYVEWQVFGSDSDNE